MLTSYDSFLKTKDKNTRDALVIWDGNSDFLVYLNDNVKLHVTMVSKFLVIHLIKSKYNPIYVQGKKLLNSTVPITK